ncbi:MAG: hypothetical protein LBO00_03240 [Zoogloeaceae bacterium]|nr:hypothetical protein [Zoogloeaceae bacterium]
MNGRGDQFLAHAGFPAQQHGKPRARNQPDFILHLAKCRALPNQFLRVARGGAIRTRHARFPLGGATAQRFHVTRCPNQSRDKAGQRMQIFQVDIGKAPRVQGVEGQQTPGPCLFRSFQEQGRAHAIVHFQLARLPDDDTVVGIGQGAIGIEPVGGAGIEQDFQARMLVQPKAPSQGIGTQPAYGKRRQLPAIAPQEQPCSQSSILCGQC